MGETLKQIRDLTIIMGIYLYFISWVYVHFYYQQFGISTESVKIDYNSYLVYSYNVLTSAQFLSFSKIFILLILLVVYYLLNIWALEKNFILLKNLGASLSTGLVPPYVKKLHRQYVLLLLIVFLVIIFPILFRIAREVAIDHYREDRRNPNHLKAIQFIFRKDADLMSPTMLLDSALAEKHIFYSDISLIKNDDQQLLRLLAESENYYIVLRQMAPEEGIGVLPSGYVYYIDKKDILLSKVILRSF